MNFYASTDLGDFRMSPLASGHSVLRTQSKARKEDATVLGMMGILLSNRREQAPRVQEILTKYGDLILCRNGVHDPAKSRGLITLTLEAAESEISGLVGELTAVFGVEVSVAHFSADSQW